MMVRAHFAVLRYAFRSARAIGDEPIRIDDYGLRAHLVQPQIAERGGNDQLQAFPGQACQD